MIENIQTRLLKQLPFWKDLKVLLDSVILLFHKPFSRRRFCVTCLGSEADADIVKEYFRGGPPLLEGGRVWGVVVKSTGWLTERKQHIQQNWSLARMQGQGVQPGEGGGGNNDADGDDGDEEVGMVWCRQSKHMVIADKAINSNMFWAKVDLVEVLSDLLGAIEHYGNGCKCHPRDLREHFNLHLDDIKRPLRMCRADDLACGALNRFFDLVCQTLVAQLIGRHAGGLSAEERGLLVDDFGIGKKFIYIELVLRISRGWASLPLRALGIGNVDDDLVVECLLDCLAQFEALSVADMSPFEWNLFSREGPLRGQVLAIVQRTHTWDQLPELRRYRLIAQFLPVMEASIERKHAQIHSSIRAAPSHSVAYTSVQGLRKAEILHELEDSVESCAQFVEFLGSECRTARECLETLGLQAHPEILPYIGDDGRVEATCPHHSAVAA